jgi:hypothetical protein
VGSLTAAPIARATSTAFTQNLRPARTASLIFQLLAAHAQQTMNDRDETNDGLTCILMLLFPFDMMH